MKDSIKVSTDDSKKTITGLKRMADEMEWMLEHLEDSSDSISIIIVKENETGHRITLTIDKPERTEDGEEGEANTSKRVQAGDGTS